MITGSDNEVTVADNPPQQLDASIELPAMTHTRSADYSQTIALADQASSAETTALPPVHSSNASDTSAIMREKETSAGPAMSDAAVANSISFGPPSLRYTIHNRKWAITRFWLLILFDSIAVPLVLYYTLWYLTDLSPNTVFSISTACIGGASIFEYVLRFWHLWRHNSTCRVIGARRWYLDYFHWNFSIAWIFIMVELIVGCIFTNPPIRLLAMPLSSLCFWFAFVLFVEDGLRFLHKPAPLRISSVAKGSPMRPGIYSILEDVVAVDGGGGTEFRTRLDERFQASHYFRQMLHRLSTLWAVGAAGAATVTTILVFTLERDAAYAVGWVLPWLWAALWTCLTFWYVKRCLRYERENWGKQVA